MNKRKTKKKKEKKQGINILPSYFLFFIFFIISQFEKN